jgi:PPE-repeat protein
LLSDIPALIADEIGHLFEFISTFQPELTVAALALLPANVGFVGGFAGLAGLGGMPQPAAVPVVPETVAAPAPSEPIPAAGMAPAVGAAPATAPATSPASAPAPASTVVSSAAPPAPPAPVVAGFAPPYIVGPPGIGFGSGMSTSASSSAKRKAPEGDTAGVGAAAAREQARARRRRRAKLRGYGDEFMDMNIEVEPNWGAPPGKEPVASTVASDQGAGPLGFAGVARKSALNEAAGLTTLVSDEFGGGPTMPMLPGSWGADTEESGAPEEGDEDT